MSGSCSSGKNQRRSRSRVEKNEGAGDASLILDLRWNPGGLLEQAVEVCEKFLPRGQLVVSTEGRNSAQNSIHKAGGRGDELVNRAGSQMPVVVLVNGSSASASEIVSGCLQDLHRRSFSAKRLSARVPCKASFRSMTVSALRLTTAKYYTPSHKVIHEVGITPNVTVPLSDDEERDIMLKRMPAASSRSTKKNATASPTRAIRSSTGPPICSRHPHLHGTRARQIGRQNGRAPNK